MSTLRSVRERLIRLTLLGACTGALLAITVPPTRVMAAEGAGCVCNDSGTGAYQCNGGQTACIAGTQKCDLTCQ